MNDRREKTRDIIHLDMDAFYASVECLDNPALRGKPVIVGGGRERGVVSSASYEAREYGVHSAQPNAHAARLCPHGIFLPVRMGRYKEISDRVFTIFGRFTPLVEPLSIDEAFLDVTGSRRLFGTPVEIAQRIRGMVRQEIGLTVSAGVAPTKFVAKIASDLHKPDGLTVVPRGKVKEFLDPLPIDTLWGVGEKTLLSLTCLGVRTISDLRRVPLELLIEKFGTHGRAMYRHARGKDTREVEPTREVKSLGREETYLEDIKERDEAQREILSLAVKVARRMRRYGFAGRTVTLKVKYSNFTQITRSVTLPKGTDDAHEIYQACTRLLEKTAVGKRRVRLLGVSLSHFSFLGEETQLSLFNEEVVVQKVKRLHQALDTVSDKFGEDIVRPATLLKGDGPKRPRG
jgi:DNA polymerase-4